ncbi:TonB-dependent receptor [Pedobacter insulae]|uniref:Carboxypeptidase regulatory-like domain-containing protein n=1 Tax=Pedobacter insulae TaxID=414048 RepID=A0A1I2UT75_9SPHI|nr:TonB-dependent receptor [Pedobacter insulae]SFG78166.1 Carboxypeptidase regulatory-like domain-containing protein [Pedobacter insulae]
MRLPFFLTIGIVCLFTSLSHAQQTTEPTTGTIKGIVRDTVHNYVLKAATVSIYRADSSVLNYQLSNNYGEFKFTNLPIGQMLRIDISNIGYETFRQNVTIPKGQSTLDLKTLVINPRNETLKEVVITIPPITYNNDTLEINAAAFKLDTNATVEDLLKKVPNITVWGDGIITVNGKEVKSLLVNGKQFFGGDNKVILQNIPKNALEKIQIFNNADRNNPLDSSLVANLKLKKGKDRSYFGKIGLGYGTNNHYQIDGNINFSTPKLQLSLIGATNDINKTPNDINTLVRNSTFKGVGTNIEYQPDFRQTGINKGTVAGAKLNYNFNPESKDWNNRSSLSSDYYFSSTESINNNQSNSITTLSTNNQIFSFSENASVGNRVNHRQNSQFTYAKKSHQLDISESFTDGYSNSSQTNIRNASNNNNQLTSTNNGSSTDNSNSQNLNLRASYGYNNYSNWKQRFKSFNMSYNLSMSNGNTDRNEITAFKDLLNPSLNRDFNRNYQTDFKNLNQNIHATISNLKYLLFGNKNLANFDGKISAKLDLANNKNKNIVEDLSGNNYQINNYLSNNLQTNQAIFTPGFSISKNFHKQLSNRYSKNLSFELTAAQQISYQDNKSIKNFQNIKKNYNNFVPTASINYSNYQYGTQQTSVSLVYNTTIGIPTINQLAPLTDSTNLYNLQRGNINLIESKNKSISVNLYRYDMRNKNTLNFNFNGAIGLIEDAIIDSSFIDANNRRNNYLANANGSKYARMYGDVRKSLKLKAAELKFGYTININFNRTPNYLNGIFNFSNNFSTDNKISTNFTFKDKFALEGTQSVATSSSKQQTLNTVYKNVTLTSGLSANYNFTKRFSVNSNISLNSNNPSIGETINFTIWNAEANYRFTKGNNAEIKLSALDLLKQNRSINNFAGTNTFTTSTRNVLQQYFMVTLSYYPRKFGKDAAKR